MSDGTKTYDQPEKKIARETALREAVLALTERRDESSCVRQTYVREARDQLLRQDTTFDRDQVSRLDTAYIRSWEQFHRTQTKSRRAGDLRVAYLAGPNPMADFEVLTRLGVHPHNIWAFENDSSAFERARRTVEGSPFRMLKLIRGNIEKFFENTPQTFDLVYLDACGAIPSKQRTLRTLATMMNNQRLESPGVLVTNFASPCDKDAVTGNEHAELIAAYLYPKSFLCGLSRSDGRCFTEGAECHGLTGELFSTRVRTDLEFFYGQYITRQIMDLGLVVVPARRVGNSAQWRRLFRFSPKDLRAEMVRNDKDLYIGQSEDAPLTTAHDNLIGGPAENMVCLGDADGRFRNLVQTWRSGMNGVSEAGFHALDCVISIEAARFAAGLASWSDGLRAVVQRSLASRMFQFCDVPMASTVVDPLLNQLGYPYHCAPRNVLRWSYVAKQTRMFMDMFVLDTCRYIYDWLPSLHLLHEGFMDISQQLVFRLALDGIAKARRWYNPEVLAGTAVIDQTTPGFSAEELESRRYLN